MTTCRIEWNGLLREKDTAKVRGPGAIIKVKPRECRLCAGAGCLEKGMGRIDECEV